MRERGKDGEGKRGKQEESKGGLIGKSRERDERRKGGDEEKGKALD